MTTCAVIPVLNEEAAIAPLVADLLAAGFSAVVVVDGGSTDATRERALEGGAQLCVETRRGYGRAVMCGAARARELGSTSVTFVDGNGMIGADQAMAVTGPVARGEFDVAIGCRAGRHLRPLQRLGNRLAIEVIARAHGVRYRDIGSLRAVSCDALAAMSLDEDSYGWPLQLHARAAALQLRICQLPVALRPRLGRSKVSGTVRGNLGAGSAFVRVLARECVLTS